MILKNTLMHFVKKYAPDETTHAVIDHALKYEPTSPFLPRLFTRATEKQKEKIRKIHNVGPFKEPFKIEKLSKAHARNLNLVTHYFQRKFGHDITWHNIEGEIKFDQSRKHKNFKIYGTDQKGNYWIYHSHSSGDHGPVSRVSLNNPARASALPVGAIKLVISAGPGQYIGGLKWYSSNHVEKERQRILDWLKRYKKDEE